MGTYDRTASDTIAQVLIEETGIQRTQPYSAEPLYSFQVMEQADKSVFFWPVFAIRTEVDPGQNDLLVALPDIFPDLRQYLFPRQTPAFSSHVRNDAKTAPEITAILYLDQGPRPERPYVRSLPGIQTFQYPGWKILLFGIRKNLPHLLSVEEVIADPLGITPGHDHPRIRIGPCQFIQKVSHVPVGAACQGTGVHQDDITPERFGPVNQTMALQGVGPGKRLGLIDPASKALDGKGRHNFS
jgi:hypothetical protein